MHDEKKPWDPDALAANVTALVDRYGYTREQLARHGGIHRTQISRWVNGQHRPSHDAVAGIIAGVRGERPDAQPTLEMFAAAAGYPGAADPPALDGEEPPRYVIEERPLAVHPVGQVFQQIVRDLRAHRGDYTEEENAELETAIAERLRTEIPMFIEIKRQELERRRRLDAQGE
jgi:transcriptional regulator with XRE-family HTH domain